MIWRKTKKSSLSHSKNIAVLLGDDILYSGSLMDLPLKDEWIVKKSIEFFNDPAPCYIHRGAVTVRLLNEIWESAASNEGTASEYVDFPSEAIIYSRRV